jgi:SAM-dependent methyltransferase
MLAPNKEIYEQELFPTTKNIDHIRWDKMYYGSCDRDLISLIPPRAKKILSIGCGFASSESFLIEKGLEVTAIPIDPIMGRLAASKGIKVTEPNFEKAFCGLDGAKFECIIFQDVLQHLEDPWFILSKASKLLADGGEIVISLPNFYYLKFLKEHFPYPILKKWSYSENLLHVVRKKDLERWFQIDGVKMTKFQYAKPSGFLKRVKMSLGIFNVILTNRILAVGKIGP